jgi:hypothetical protein
MLPRLGSDVEVREEDRELALDLAENLFPGAVHIDQLDKESKPWWILVSSKVLRGDKGMTRFVEAFSRVFRPGVEAQVDDILKRQEVDFADQGRRAEAEELERKARDGREEALSQANLAEKAQAMEERKERWAQERKERDKHLELEEQERTTKLKNGSLKERLAMGMAVVAFAVALVVLYVGLESGQKYVAGGSGLAGLAALAAIIRLLFLDNARASTPPRLGESPPA